MPELNCAPNDAIGENMEVKKEQLDAEDMPIFESESTYLDNNIKKEIKIEPHEGMNDDQMLKDHDTSWKSNQNSHNSSIVPEKSEEQYENMEPNIKIKREETEFEEMPIFERDSAYLDEGIKKEIKTEPY